MQLGGGCSLQIGAGFGWNELRVPLQVVCLYRGGNGGALSPDLPHISPATTWGPWLCSQPCPILPGPSATAAPGPVLAVASPQGHQGTAGRGQGAPLGQREPHGIRLLPPEQRRSPALRGLWAAGFSAAVLFSRLICSCVSKLAFYPETAIFQGVGELHRSSPKTWWLPRLQEGPSGAAGCPPVMGLRPGSGLGAGLGAARRPAPPALRAPPPQCCGFHTSSLRCSVTSRGARWPRGQGVLRSAQSQHQSRSWAPTLSCHCPDPKLGHEHRGFGETSPVPPPRATPQGCWASGAVTQDRAGETSSFLFLFFSFSSPARDKIAGEAARGRPVGCCYERRLPGPGGVTTAQLNSPRAAAGAPSLTAPREPPEMGSPFTSPRRICFLKVTPKLGEN